MSCPSCLLALPVYFVEAWLSPVLSLSDGLPGAAFSRSIASRQTRAGVVLCDFIACRSASACSAVNVIEIVFCVLLRLFS